MYLFFKPSVAGPSLLSEKGMEILSDLERKLEVSILGF